MNTLQAVKGIALTRLGLLRLWRYANRRKIVILTLHDVVDQDLRGAWKPLRPASTAQQLESALEVLRRHYRFISLDHSIEILAGRADPVLNAALITFDDGYRNQFKYALPILRKFEIPGTFYVATQPIDSREPYWFDRLDYIFQHSNVHGRRFLVGGTEVQFDASTPAAMRNSYAKIRRLAKRLSDDATMNRDLNAIAEELEAEAGRTLADLIETDDWSGLPTWAELREFNRDPLVTIGSHTVTHARLGCVTDDIARRELMDSKQRIETEIGEECRHFCFPSGSFNAASPGLVEECGYHSAVTSTPGLIDMKSDRFTLRRLPWPNFAQPRDVLANASGFNNALWSLRRNVTNRFAGRHSGGEPTSLPAD